MRLKKLKQRSKDNKNRERTTRLHVASELDSLRQLRIQDQLHALFIYAAMFSQLKCVVQSQVRYVPKAKPMLGCGLDLEHCGRARFEGATQGGCKEVNFAASANFTSRG